MNFRKVHLSVFSPKRWRKCVIVVDSLNNVLHDVGHNFIDRDRQQGFKRFMDKKIVRNPPPKYARDVKDIK
jgi:hypothetical protein